MSKMNRRLDNLVDIINRLKLHTRTYTDKEMVEAAGISRSALDKWRQQDSAPETSIRKIATRLGIRYEWLANGDGLPIKEIPETDTNLTQKEKSSRSKRICALFDILDEVEQAHVYPQIIALLKSEIN